MKAYDRQPRFQFVKTINRQRKIWWTGLPCFHYSIFLLFCALAFYISHLEDSTLVLLRGSLTHESGVWSFDSTRSSFSLSMATKETYMLKCSGDEDCWAFIAFNVIVIKSWFWKKKLWSFPEQKRKKPTSLISAGPDQSFTGGLILVSSPSPSSWQMFRFTESGFDKIDKKMRSMFYKETELCQIVHGVSLAPAFAKYVTAHGEMAFPLILTNDQCSGSKVDTFLKFR